MSDVIYRVPNLPTRAAHAKQRVERSAVGAARGRDWVSDGPVDAAADRALLGWTQRVAVPRMSPRRLLREACHEHLLPTIVTRPLAVLSVLQQQGREHQIGKESLE